MSGVAAVLLIACSNVAGLMLRAASRQREWPSADAAAGGRRLLTGVLIASAGGAFGLLALLTSRARAATLRGNSMSRMRRASTTCGP